MKITLIALTLFLLAGCAALAPKNENGYPAQVVKNIISGCEKTASAKEICPCMAEKLQKKYSFKEFAEIEKAIGKGQTPQEFQNFAKEAAQQCATQINK